MKGWLNIPYAVSNGYLVFCPDIYYKWGSAGKSVLNYVVSAGEMMAKLPYVDPAKMGIQGHSMGGYEVNYIIANSKMFAAAASAAGYANFISGSGTPSPNGREPHLNLSFSQSRLGASLWENLDMYIENSPLFNTEKVVTPLLIMHNKKDGSVPYSQSIEYFTALRFLNKKAWLLQYDESGHQLDNDRDAKDFYYSYEAVF